MTTLFLARLEVTLLLFSLPVVVVAVILVSCWRSLSRRVVSIIVVRSGTSYHNGLVRRVRRRVRSLDRQRTGKFQRLLLLILGYTGWWYHSTEPTIDWKTPLWLYTAATNLPLDENIDPKETCDSQSRNDVNNPSTCATTAISHCDGDDDPQSQTTIRKNYDHGKTNYNIEDIEMDEEYTKRLQSFQNLLQKVEDSWQAYFSSATTTAATSNDSSTEWSLSRREHQEQTIVRMVMEHVGMDPNLVERVEEKDDGKSSKNNNGNKQHPTQQQQPSLLLSYNWFQELHLRIQQLPPSNAFWKVYFTKPSSRDFRDVILIDNYAQEKAAVDGTLLLQELRRWAFVPHRHRGMVPALSVSFSSQILQPLQRYVAYATPSNALLEELTRTTQPYLPIVEMGAGNGYWSAALQQQYYSLQQEQYAEAEFEEEKILAFDIEPSSSNNMFTYGKQPFTKVHKGSCRSIFQNTTTTVSHHRDWSRYTLLMVWPNNPDASDNPQYHHTRNDNHKTNNNDDDDADAVTFPKIWDAECLELYLGLGGSTVIYVGEREANIQSKEPDCGMSSSRRFQEQLTLYFDLVQQFDIPTWWGVDDATIWKRKPDVPN